MKKIDLICILCPMGCSMEAYVEDGRISKLTGNRCRRGMDYAQSEVFDPRRVLCTTVRVSGGKLPVLPVKTEVPIPKDMLKECIKVLAGVRVKAPVKIGERIVKNICGLEVDVVATRSLPADK